MIFGILLGKDKNGQYKAICPTLPVCSERGKTKAEALKKLKRSIFKFVKIAVENMFLDMALTTFLPPLEFPYPIDKYYPQNMESVFNVHMAIDTSFSPVSDTTLPPADEKIVIGMMLSLN
jgi:predicted RNase H-like HicB family nuclease